MRIFQVIELHKKASAMKELPARKIAYLDSFRTKDINAVISELRKKSNMNIVNDVSDVQCGVGEITQLLPNGQLQTWRRNDYPGEAVTQGILNIRTINYLLRTFFRDIFIF